MRAEAPTPQSVWLVVPGAIETLTGGYLFDRLIFGELAASGWEVHTLALDRSFPTPTPAALAQAADKLATIPDGALVVIDGLALAGLVAQLPAIVPRLNAIALIHHPLAEETGLDAERAAQLAAAERAALALVSQVIVTSPWTRRRLADYGVAPERVMVVEPGVERGPARHRDASSGVRLLTVATVTPRKGHDVLVEALTRLRHLDWSLRCAGSLEHDPRHAQKLRAQIEAHALGDRIALLGELSPGQVRSEYASADLFVLPSYLEGYGMALAEAVAHGLPVVSTTAGAIPDTVPRAASRLVAAGDIDALTETLREVIGDTAALRRLARGAREAAAMLPSWEEAGRKFAAALDQSRMP